MLLSLKAYVCVRRCVCVRLWEWCSHHQTAWYWTAVPDYAQRCLLISITEEKHTYTHVRTQMQDQREIKAPHTCRPALTCRPQMGISVPFFPLPFRLCSSLFLSENMYWGLYHFPCSSASSAGLISGYKSARIFWILRLHVLQRALLVCRSICSRVREKEKHGKLFICKERKWNSAASCCIHPAVFFSVSAITHLIVVP